MNTPETNDPKVKVLKKTDLLDEEELEKVLVARNLCIKSKAGDFVKRLIAQSGIKGRVQRGVVDDLQDAQIRKSKLKGGKTPDEIREDVLTEIEVHILESDENMPPAEIEPDANAAAYARLNPSRWKRL